MAITEKDMDKIADKILDKLKKEGEVKMEKVLTSFQKTEKLLFELKYLKGAIDVKHKHISGLKNDPVLLNKKEIFVYLCYNN